MITSYIKEISEMDWLKCNDSIAKLMFYVESSQIHLHYHEVVVAKKFITEAQMLVGLDIELSGAYGKRTQFQKKAVPQLFVKLKRNKAKQESDIVLDSNFYCPFDLCLQD
ncbi:Tetratricopeptide repeat protein 27, partial [Stegodyphus mimosarum]